MDREEKTKNFIKQVQNLVSTGSVRNHQEVIKELEWNKSMFSQIMNGQRNVPIDKYNKFVEVYGVALHNPEQMRIESIFTMMAYCKVTLSVLAEILANQRGQPVAKISSDLVSLVNLELKALLEK